MKSGRILARVRKAGRATSLRPSRQERIDEKTVDLDKSGGAALAAAPDLKKAVQVL